MERKANEANVGCCGLASLVGLGFFQRVEKMEVNFMSTLRRVGQMSINAILAVRDFFKNVGVVILMVIIVLLILAFNDWSTTEESPPPPF